MNEEQTYELICSKRFEQLEGWQERQNGTLQRQSERIDGIYKLLIGGLITLVMLMLGTIINLILLLVNTLKPLVG